MQCKPPEFKYKHPYGKFATTIMAFQLIWIVQNSTGNWIWIMIIEEFDYLTTWKKNYNISKAYIPSGIWWLGYSSRSVITTSLAMLSLLRMISTAWLMSNSTPAHRKTGSRITGLVETCTRYLSIVGLILQNKTCGEWRASSVNLVWKLEPNCAVSTKSCNCLGGGCDGWLIETAVGT